MLKYTVQKGGWHARDEGMMAVQAGRTSTRPMYTERGGVQRATGYTVGGASDAIDTEVGKACGEWQCPKEGGLAGKMRSAGRRVDMVV